MNVDAHQGVPVYVLSAQVRPDTHDYGIRLFQPIRGPTFDSLQCLPPVGRPPQ